MAGPYYWVGGSGNTSDATTHWSTSSGGAGGVANIPGATDDVIADAASNATAYTITVDATFTCKDLTLGNPGTSGVLTVDGAGVVNIYGSSSLATGIIWNGTGNLTYKATSGIKTVTSNSVVFTSINIYFDGVGGTFQLVDDLSVLRFNLDHGTFDPNLRKVTLSGLNIAITGAITFYDLTINGSANKGASCRLWSGNYAVTHNLIVAGNSSINRILMFSSTKGTPRTITAANVSVTNADFQDITGAGAGSWDLSAVAGGTYDYGGNTGIRFTYVVDRMGRTPYSSQPINIGAFWAQANAQAALHPLGFSNRNRQWIARVYGMKR